MGDEPTYLSPEGLAKLKAELEEFKTVKRQEISTRLAEAKSLGDLTENSEYMEAKEAQEQLEKRIAELELLTKNVVLIQKNGEKSGVVIIGSTVEIEAAGVRETYTIVGSEEARPLEGRISNESPLGKAFLGHRVGDKITVQAPAGERTCK
ncbi:transcription elongation factor GreA, partial [Candidatus Parcubacteria bacterium]|nr:transcription elongation factor GreA [Candidatus Parcubacteria bacterium]